MPEKIFYINSNERVLMNLLDALLVFIAKLYLTHCPVTEGKRRLYDIVKSRFYTDDPLQAFSTKHGFQLKGNLNNPDHLFYYFFGEEDERYEIRAVKKLIREGDVIWDIGTNIGFYTCLFSILTGSKGRVVAFEPARVTYSKMVENVQLNLLKNVDVNNIGVSEKNGVMRLFSEEVGMLEGRASLSIPSRSGIYEEVLVESLDVLGQKFPPPSFMKIDVEEHQLSVLTGGRKLLSDHSPIIFAELKHRDPSVMNMTDDLLNDLGYSLFKMRKNSFCEVESTSGSGSRNLLAVRKSSPQFQRIQPYLG